MIAIPTSLTGYDVELPAGMRLLEALRWLLDETACVSANGQLVGGELAEFGYYIPDVGPPDGPVANFSKPYPGSAPGEMIRGGITIGRREGAVWCHSHSLFVDANGVQRAGHLIPDQVVLGSGVRARVWGGREVVNEVQPDPETHMSLFTPRRIAEGVGGDAIGGEPGPGAERALVCRLRPNIDLVHTIESLVEQQDWDGAEVRGQVGSLIGGRLEQPDGSVAQAAGPATEVMFLEGAVRRIDGRMTADLQAHLVDRFAEVYSGRLLPGENPVAMTYELVLTESSARRAAP